MPDFIYTVTVNAETRSQADQVMANRLLYDEEYSEDTAGTAYPGGFDYGISYTNNAGSTA